jgi:predicted nucleic acid-binding protein
MRRAGSLGLRATGTLGILDLAAEQGLIDFAAAIASLEATNFRKPIAITDALKRKHLRGENE